MTDVEKMIYKIRWKEYKTAYGNADEDIPHYVPIKNTRGYTPKVSTSLFELFSPDKKKSMDATHDLWCGLCHQHSYVSTAALPSFDVLLIALKTLDDRIKVEILDIFLGFAYCTSNDDILMNNWKGLLRNKMIENIEYFKELSEHSSEEISSFALNILDELFEDK